MAYKQKSPIIVAEGGTGAQTLTGVCIGNGTSAITGQAITQHDVLVGGASNAITSVAPSATSGVPLISQGAAADPAFGTVVVAGGGTGVTTMTTAYAPVCAGTTATGALQVASTGLSTSGYVLTSNGAAALPSFQALPSGSISITGDSGGALTGTSFTLTGGSTGLTFAGAGTTETLGGTLAIANGGTNATSMATSTGIVKYDGTRLVTSSTAKIDSSNRQTNTSQPCFKATSSVVQSNATGDNTVVTVNFATVVFDNNSNYDSGTSIFTAPVTGRYHFDVSVNFSGITSSHTLGQIYFVSSSEGTTTMFSGNFANIRELTFNTLVAGGGIVANMTAADTMKIQVDVANGTKVVGVKGVLFAGYLIC